jgi:hypothetical protein
MSRLTTQYPERVYTTDEERRRHSGMSREGGIRRGGNGLLLAGLAVVGFGALALYYLGPDLRRYLKIRNM